MLQLQAHDVLHLLNVGYECYGCRLYADLCISLHNLVPLWEEGCAESQITPSTAMYRGAKYKASIIVNDESDDQENI